MLPVVYNIFLQDQVKGVLKKCGNRNCETQNAGQDKVSMN